MLKARVTRVSNFLGVTFIAIISAISCTTGSCLEETESAAKAGFYETGSGNIITIDTITVYGLGMDASLLYNKATSRNNILLPLNPATETSSFILTSDGKTDTITIEYASFPHLVSKECGYSMFNSIISCISTKNIIDTVLVKNSEVNTSYHENIRIFF